MDGYNKKGCRELVSERNARKGPALPVLCGHLLYIL